MTLHRALTGVHSRYINKIAERLAGRRGSLADLEHVGRTSGVVRHTPLRVFRTGDTVVIGLNFGRESDWLKNIAAAGGCRMRSLRDTNLQLAPGVAGYSDNELDAVVTDGLRRQLAAGVTHDA